MRFQLSEKSAAKLQRILSKRFGRELTELELQTAYTTLMEFTYALLSIDDDCLNTKKEASCNAKN